MTDTSSWPVRKLWPPLDSNVDSGRHVERRRTPGSVPTWGFSISRKTVVQGGVLWFQRMSIAEEDASFLAKLFPTDWTWKNKATFSLPQAHLFDFLFGPLDSVLTSASHHLCSPSAVDRELLVMEKETRADGVCFVVMWVTPKKRVSSRPAKGGVSAFFCSTLWSKRAREDLDVSLGRVYLRNYVWMAGKPGTGIWYSNWLQLRISKIEVWEIWGDPMFGGLVTSFLGSLDPAFPERKKREWVEFIRGLVSWWVGVLFKGSPRRVELQNIFSGRDVDRDTGRNLTGPSGISKAWGEGFAGLACGSHHLCWYSLYIGLCQCHRPKEDESTRLHNWFWDADS